MATTARASAVTGTLYTEVHRRRATRGDPARRRGRRRTTITMLLTEKNQTLVTTIANVWMPTTNATPSQ
jgi:hypothetical protein